VNNESVFTAQKALSAALEKQVAALLQQVLEQKGVITGLKRQLDAQSEVIGGLEDQKRGCKRTRSSSW
jgi:hypothetical protein